MASGIPAGKLNKRINILSPSPSRNNYGENVPTYPQIARVWAQIEPLSGRNLALAQANTITATATHRIRIRFNDKVKVTHRVQYGTNDLAYSTLTTAQYRTLTTDQYEGLEGVSSLVRLFSINQILDDDMSHFSMTLLCTEVVS
jgi:SPP1 family predicted phage head-tail adaptor